MSVVAKKKISQKTSHNLLQTPSGWFRRKISLKWFSKNEVSTDSIIRRQNSPPPLKFLHCQHKSFVALVRKEIAPEPFAYVQHCFYTQNDTKYVGEKKKKNNTL